MQAIAMLVQDDPYLKLTPEQRCDARRERKGRLFTRAIEGVQEVVEVPIDKTHRIELDIIYKEPPPAEPSSVEQWVERQKTIYKPWFSIEEEIHTDGKKKICISEIQRAICKYFGVSQIDLIGARRTVQIVRPRQVGYYLAKMLTIHSLPEIGRRFGGRDHTSALSGIRKIERLRKTDEALNSDVLTLAASLGGAIV